MPLLIDTYNLLHVTGILPPELAGIDVDELAELLASSRFGRTDAWLVCDGTSSRRPARSGHGNHIVIQYAGAGMEADEVIRQLVERSSSPRRLTIVSSDHRVQRMAKRRRCRVEESDVFLAKLVHDARSRRPGTFGAKPETPLEPDQVNRWVRLFGLEAELLAIQSSKVGSPTIRKHDRPTKAIESAPAIPRRRALEGVMRLEDVDPEELERFDMGEWLS